jgi:uncharacterized protein YmfQ (DUF2313 family)
MSEKTELGISKIKPQPRISIEAETLQSFQTPSAEQQLEKRWEGYLTEAGMSKFGHMSYREKGITEETTKKPQQKASFIFGRVTP